MSFSLDELIQKMTTLELVVSRLLALEKATPIQREKLEQLEVMICSIPEQCEYTASVWRSKLSLLKKQYDSVLAKTQEGLPSSAVDYSSDDAAHRRSVQFNQDGLKVTVRTVPTTSTAASISIFNQPGLSVKGEPTDDDMPKATVPQVVVKEEPTDECNNLDLPQPWMNEEVTDYQTDTDSVNDDHSEDCDRSVDSMADQLGDMSLVNKSSDKSTWPKLKSVIVVPEETRKALAAKSRDPRQSLKSKLGRKFAKVPVVSDGTDFRHLKTLLRTVMQTFDLVPPQLADPELQSLVFQLAAGKLAPPYGQLYLDEYNDTSLFSLFSFLRLEMEAYTDNFHHQLVASGRTRVPKGKFNSCSKCQVQGHELDVCPLNLCPNCFTPGHTVYTCTRGPIFTNN